MAAFIQDLRFGARQLRKSPGFTLIAVLTLALGIAVNATMFSMVSVFLLRQPPGREPKRIAVVTSIDPAGGYQADASQISVPNYLAWRQANHLFSEVAGADLFRSVSLTTNLQSSSLPAAAVSANFFHLLGANAAWGRTFAAGEDRPGQDRVVILGHELWERQFGSDPGIVGRVVRLNRENYNVVGVLPASFRLTGYACELWIPLTVSESDQTAAARRDRNLFLFARLQPGVSIEQARSEVASLARRSEESFPDTEKGWGATARTLPNFLFYAFDIGTGLAVIMTTVAFVLLIACANVAGLLLARATGRRKELAIRVSLGAAPLRLVRQLLTEGVLIAGLGGALGLVISYWGIQFIRANMAFSDAFRTLDLRLDPNVLLFSLAVSALCAVLCSLAPALQAARADVNSQLKDESRASSAGQRQSRLRHVMVTGEIALALFLLVGTGLLLIGISRIEHQNLGFQADHLLTAGITLDAARYKDSVQQAAFVQELIPRLEGIPGAKSVAATSDLPATGPAAVSVHLNGLPDPANSLGFNALDSVVSPGFFRTAGIELRSGRTLSDADTATAPRVVVVNQKFVERYLSNQEPLGKRIRLDVNGGSPGWSEIVGVVGNVKTYSETTKDDPAIYESILQRPIAKFSVMVRSASNPDSLATALRSAVAQLDPELPLARVMSMSAVIDYQKAGNPFFSRVLGVFALLALMLSGIGVYGLIAYSVGQRTREIGVRMALGAARGDVLRLVLHDGLKMTAIGGVIGIILSLPLPKVFGAIFYDVKVAEPRLYLLVPLAILAVAMLATYIPARRAADIEPLGALRQD
jgi:putative ABC transport system permease protein